VRPDLVAGFDDGIAEIVQHLALPLIGLHRGLDLIDRPAGDFAGFLITALHYALFEPRMTSSSTHFRPRSHKKFRRLDPTCSSSKMMKSSSSVRVIGISYPSTNRSISF